MATFKEHKERVDVYTLTLDSASAKLAVELTEMLEASGRTVIDRIVTVAGTDIRVRQILASGKREGEGQIAESMKKIRAGRAT